MNDKPVYWDDEEKRFYWIEWEETGNNDIPHRHYLPELNANKSSIPESRKPIKKIVDYWAKYYISETLGLCMLCGNTGYIDTTNTAISPAGIKVGRKCYCICPNGQSYRRSHCLVDEKEDV